jgi:hypothetical protein
MSPRRHTYWWIIDLSMRMLFVLEVLNDVLEFFPVMRVQVLQINQIRPVVYAGIF